MRAEILTQPTTDILRSALLEADVPIRALAASEARRSPWCDLLREDFDVAVEGIALAIAPDVVEHLAQRSAADPEFGTWIAGFLGTDSLEGIDWFPALDWIVGDVL